MISASAGSLLAFSALSQDPPRRDRPDYTRERTTYAERANRLNDAAKASDIIGMAVKNYQDEKLGKVDELAVDVESGRVLQVILSIGGFLGLGDTLKAVPPGALHHDVAQKVLHLDADKEKLKAAPKFEMSKWAECCDSDHLGEVYRYYDEEPAFNFIHEGEAVPGSVRNPEIRRNTEGSRDTWDRDRASQSRIPASRLGHIQKASKVMGMAVKNLQDEKLGDVENLVVDLPAGRIVAVIISSGGFIGIGDELSAVPPSAFRFNSDRTALQLDVSKEALTQAPHFKSNQWPDLADPTYAESVYRAYRVQPYFSTDRADARNVRDRDDRSPTSPDRGAADNTARNVRDRDDRTVTPLDQGNSKADVDTTAQIRKEIVAGKNMSVNARNVKVITNKGKVTLRGPVNSAEEKRLIGEIAERIARPGNVDNQLEVKLTTSSK